MDGGFTFCVTRTVFCIVYPQRIAVCHFLGVLYKPIFAVDCLASFSDQFTAIVIQIAVRAVDRADHLRRYFGHSDAGLQALSLFLCSLDGSLHD